MAQHAHRPALAVSPVLLLLLVLAQLTLGALNVLSGLRPWLNSAHVVAGAPVLTTHWSLRFGAGIRCFRRHAQKTALLWGHEFFIVAARACLRDSRHLVRACSHSHSLDGVEPSAET